MTSTCFMLLRKARWVWVNMARRPRMMKERRATVTMISINEKAEGRRPKSEGRKMANDEWEVRKAFLSLDTRHSTLDAFSLMGPSRSCGVRRSRCWWGWCSRRDRLRPGDGRWPGREKPGG